MEKRLSLVIDGSKAKAGADQVIAQVKRAQEAAQKAISSYEKLSSSVFDLSKGFSSLNAGMRPSTFNKMKESLDGTQASLSGLLATTKSSIGEFNKAVGKFNSASSSLEKLKEKSTQARTSFGEFDTSMKNLSKSIGTYTKSVDGYTSKIDSSLDKFRKGIDDTNKKFTSLRSEVSSSSKVFSNLATQVSNARENFKTLNNPLSKASGYMDKMNLAAVDSSYAFNQVSKATNSAGVQMNAYANKAEKAVGSTQKFREQLVTAQKNLTTFKNTTSQLTDQVARTDAKMKSLGNEFSQLGKAMKGAVAALDSAVARQKALEAQAAKLNTRLNQQAKAARESSTAMQGLATAFTGLSFGMIARDVARLADEYTGLQNKIAVVTGETENQAETSREMLKVANNTWTSLEAVGDVYSKLTRVNKEYGYSQEELLAITTTVSKAVSMSGATAQGAQGAMIQFAQALAGDFKAAAQELNSIIEQTPGLAETMAAGLEKIGAFAKVSSKDLKTLAADGQITTEMMLQALKAMEGVVNAQFDKAAMRIADSMQLLKNSTVIAVGELDDAFGVTSFISGTVKELTANTDEFKSSIKGLATTLGLLGAGAAYGALSFVVSVLGPVGLIVTGLSLIAGGLVALQSEFNRTKDTVKGLADEYERMTGKQLKLTDKTAMTLSEMLNDPEMTPEKATASLNAVVEKMGSLKDRMSAVKAAQDQLKKDGGNSVFFEGETKAAWELQGMLTRLGMQSTNLREEQRMLNTYLEMTAEKTIETSEATEGYVKSTGAANDLLAKLQEKLDPTTAAWNQYSATLAEIALATDDVNLQFELGEAALDLLNQTLDKIAKKGAKAAVKEFDKLTDTIHDLANESDPLYETQMDMRQAWEDLSEGVRKHIKLQDGSILTMEKASEIFQKYAMEVTGANDEIEEFKDNYKDLMDEMNSDIGNQQIEGMYRDQINATQGAYEKQVLQAQLARDLEIRAAEETFKERKKLLDDNITSQEEYTQGQVTLHQWMNNEKARIDDEYNQATRDKFDQWLIDFQDGMITNNDLLIGMAETLNESLAGSIEGLIMGTMTLEDAFRNVGRSIVESVIGSLAQMAAQWITNQILASTMGSATTAASAAMASATAAAWAPAAALASLASFGANSAPAMAGMTATAALGQTLSMVGMAHDGIDSVPSTGTWLLEKGERVVTSNTSAKLDSTLDNISNKMENGRSRGGATVNQTINVTGNVDRRTRNQIAADAARKQRMVESRFSSK